MATIRFVATQVLSSDDGLSYKTEDVESEEARKARLEKERSAQGRTLWEQLEDQKAKKKEEYDAVTKQIFAPPKALDEEEVAYLDSVRQREESRDRRRAEEEERELAAFAIARANRDLNHLPAANPAANPAATAPPSALAKQGGGEDATRKEGAEKKAAAFPEVKLNVKIKRKEKGSSGKEEGGEGKGKGKKKAKVAAEEGKDQGPKAAAAAPNPMLAMMATYGSDDDEEED